MALPQPIDKVIVIIIQDRCNISRATLITSLFSDPLFEVHEMEPIVMPPVSNHVDEIYEMISVRQALTRAFELAPTAPCIVIKSTSVSNSDPDTVAAIVRKSLTVSFDLCYLCKWLDMCQLYKQAIKEPVSVIKDEKMTLMKTKSPHGIQTILFSVTGRDIVLGKTPMANGDRFVASTNLSERLTEEIFNGNIAAICAVPNLFDFDIVLNATTNKDFIKVNNCVPVNLVTEQTNNGSNLIWFAVLVLLILIVAWAMIKIGPQTRV